MVRLESPEIDRGPAESIGEWGQYLLLVNWVGDESSRVVLQAL